MTKYQRIRNRIEGMRKVIANSPAGLEEALHSSFTQFLLLDLESIEGVDLTTRMKMDTIYSGLKTKKLTPEVEDALNYFIGETA
jgi:hypothetical protein